MLPFLKNRDDKSQTGIIVQERAPDADETDMGHSEAIAACATDLINAVHAKDTQGVADALYDAFEIMDSMPHEEAAEHIEPHSYDAQNQKAATQKP